MEYRALVRVAKERRADGIKLIGPMDRDQVAAVLDEAKKVGLPTTVHVAVGEASARDFVDLGANCIEHFYGVPDAALNGIQAFPPEMNYANEIHRFGLSQGLHLTRATKVDLTCLASARGRPRGPALPARSGRRL